MDQSIQLPGKAAYILDVLMRNGYEAYVVGGCVRDSILGRQPGDWDITTSASPWEVKHLFHRTIDTGIQHGTVTVMLGKEGFEVTTYRLDGEYEDNRHPKKVVFTRDLTEDLKRRDFTMNAMAYNDQNGLVDIFDGRTDLKERRVRCVGDPRERFDEDALRMLRAVRFAGQLGFSIDAASLKAIEEKARTISNISVERIYTELDKLLCSCHPECFRIAWQTGLTSFIMPEFDSMMRTEQKTPHHCYNVGEHTLHALMELASEYQKDAGGSGGWQGKKLHSVLAWALLLHDCGKPACRARDASGVDHFHGHAEKSAGMAKKILKRLRADNYTVENVCCLIAEHDARLTENETALRRIAARIGTERMDALFTIQRMDILAQSPELLAGKLASLSASRKVFRKIRDRGDCLTVKDLKVNGKDLLEFGIKKGPKIGETLTFLLQEVLENPEKNNREDLLSMLPLASTEKET